MTIRYVKGVFGFGFILEKWHHETETYHDFRILIGNVQLRWKDY